MRKIGLIIVFLLIVPTIFAQQITEDEVNQIAKRMYCPVCENIPLDACGTAACADWRYEIRLMMEQGFTEEQIRADFVDRFGDRVVGTPQDPALRALSLVTPWLLGLIALMVGLMTFWKWNKAAETKIEKPAPSATPDANDYRSILEKDLYGGS